MTDVKRKRLMVHSFQHRFMAMNLIYFLILLTAAAITFFAPLIVPASEGDRIAQHLLSINGRVWPALLVVAGFFVFHSILVSHKVAGALFRFSSVFGKVAGGDLTARAVIRHRDYLHEEAIELNSMIANLHVRVGDVAQSHDALLTLIKKLDKAVDNGARQTVEEAVEDIREEVDRLGSRLDLFHMEPRKMIITEESLDCLPPIRMTVFEDSEVVVSE